MKIASGTRLTAIQRTEASRARGVLETAKFRSRLYAKALGYTLLWEDFKDPGVSAMLVKKLTRSYIILQEGLSQLVENACISHEHCHEMFHPDYSFYRRESVVMIDKYETQAEMFASLVLIPDLSLYPTLTELERSGYPASIIECRLLLLQQDQSFNNQRI